MYKIRENQLTRKKIKEERNKQGRRLLLAAGLVASISLSIAYFSLAHNVKADTAKPLQSTVELVEKEKESPKADSKNSQLQAGLEKVQVFKKLNRDVKVLEEVGNSSKIVLNLKVDDYVAILSEKDGWSKIDYKNIVGYIPTDSLDSLGKNELVVKHGILLATKNYTIPEDFKYQFSLDAENALMVMFEAMTRDGLEISVSRKYVDSDQIEEYEQKDDKEYTFPSKIQHELRTGKAIEFKIPDAATVVNFNDTQQGLWLSKNAYKYGFVQRYPKGKEKTTGFLANDRIYSYVGLKIAKEMHKKDMTMEEYFSRY